MSRTLKGARPSTSGIDTQPCFPIGSSKVVCVECSGGSRGVKPRQRLFVVCQYMKIPTDLEPNPPPLLFLRLADVFE